MPFNDVRPPTVQIIRMTQHLLNVISFALVNGSHMSKVSLSWGGVKEEINY